MATMKGKLRKGALFILVVGLALMAYSIICIQSEPNVLEYMYAAGKVTTTKNDDGAEIYKSDLDGQLKALEKLPAQLEGEVTGITLSGGIANVELSNEYGQVAVCPLVTLGENAFESMPRYLLDGRLLYSSEFKNGSPVMLVDEELALALFQMTNVVGREATMTGTAYRIVGVLRHHRRVGEAAEYFAYIPLQNAHQNGMQLDTLTLRATPAVNAGARISFEKAAQELSKAGTLYDAQREKTGATLLARLVLCGFAFALLHSFFRRWIRSVKQLRDDNAKRLEQAYMPRVIPRTAVGVIGRALILAVLVAATAATFTILIQPVYVFTDYVPAVLVEPEEIIKTFWNVQSQHASGTIFRTVNAARIAFFGGLCNVASVMVLYGLLRIRREGVKTDERK